MKKSDREYKTKRKAEMIAALEKADDPRQYVHDAYKGVIKSIVLAALIEFVSFMHEHDCINLADAEKFVSDFVEKNCIPAD